jgi:hypothetical protein
MVEAAEHGMGNDLSVEVVVCCAEGIRCPIP